MFLQRLATGVKQARYRRRPTRGGSEALVRACAVYTQRRTVFHAKRVECAMFHLLVNISGILHARPTYDISSRSPIFGDHFHTNDKVSHDSHVTQLAEEVTRF